MRFNYSTDYHNAKDHIYGIAHNMGKDREEQIKLVDELHKIEMRYLTNKSSKEETIKEMLYILVNTLNEG